MACMATALGSSIFGGLSVQVHRFWGFNTQRLAGPRITSVSSLTIHSLPAKSAKAGCKQLLISKELMENARNVVCASLISSFAASSKAAMAVQINASEVQQLADATENDSRGLILLLVLLPALGWVLYNILPPALNQLNRMKVSKGFIGALGLSGAAATFGTYVGVVPEAEAVQEIATIADSDSRGLVILFVLLPALGWVLFNILQPALNQVNKMRQ